MNNRLVEWAEHHNLQKDEQAGYRKNTVSLQSLCQKYVTKKKFYVIFIIDFKKVLLHIT